MFTNQYIYIYIYIYIERERERHGKKTLYKRNNKINVGLINKTEFKTPRDFRTTLGKVVFQDWSH